MEDERDIVRARAQGGAETDAPRPVESSPRGPSNADGDFRVLMRFSVSPPQPCPYLSDRIERKIWTEISGTPLEEYSRLSRRGFRRSHMIAYKPACPSCDACVSIRVPVRRFAWTKSWRRIWNRNGDLTARLGPPRSTPEQYMLFERYLLSRHGEGDMAGMGFLEYRWMIEDGPQSAQVAEFVDGSGSLLGACLLDRLDDGLSAVYSFFEPDQGRRSLGTYIILWLIAEAARRDLDYAYLGYWIADSDKMDYKARFKPVEGLDPDGQWRPVAARQPLKAS